MFRKQTYAHLVTAIVRFRLALILACCLIASVAAMLLPSTSARVSGPTAWLPAESPCVAPGLTVVTDPTGDTGTGSLGTAPGTPAQDITDVFFAEPAQPDGVSRIIATIRVADLTTTPASGMWRAFFAFGGTTYFVEIGRAHV